ncbi:DUF4421 family protein [Pseudobacteriovorax antillogorgiicola]|nr:DUF4421 family protein [Pseudobacteriovorax antillogorgiicola]
MTNQVFAKSPSSVFVGWRQPDLGLEVDDEGLDNKDGDVHRLIYEPKLPNILVLGFSWRGLTVSGSLDVQLEDDDKSVDYTDYKLGWYESWFGIDGSYTSFERFRITETSGFNTELSDDDLFKRDLVATFIAASLYAFPLAWRYDFEAAFDPSKEKQTGIGLGLIGSWNSIDIESMSGLVPSDWQAAFGGDGGFTNGTLTGYNLQLALGGTLAWQGLFLTALYASGEGQHEFTYTVGPDERDGDGDLNKLTERFAAGYSGKFWYLVFSLEQESPTYALRFMSLTPSRRDMSLVFGIKWN